MTKHEILLGESLDIDIVCTDKDGNAVDLTDKVVHIVATERLGTRKVLFKYKSGVDDQINIIDIVNGRVNLTVLNTTGFTSVDYFIEVAYVNLDNYVVKLDPILLTVIRSFTTTLPDSVTDALYISPVLDLNQNYDSFDLNCECTAN